MAYAQRIRVFLLHHDPVAQVGLCTALARHDDFAIANAELGPDARPHRGNTDVVVADYAHGIALAQGGARRAAGDGDLRILIVAASVREWEVRCALARGVLGYVLAGSAVDDLAAAIRAVHLGVRHLGPQVAQTLADCLSGDPLTYRETQVLRLVVDGLSNKAIARRLDIAVGTVKSHLKGVFDKLNVDSRTQAIRTAERRGLLCEENLPVRRAGPPATQMADRAPGL